MVVEKFVAQFYVACILNDREHFIDRGGILIMIVCTEKDLLYSVCFTV